MRQSHQREEGGVMRSLRVGRVAGRRKRQRGAELVEALVTLLIFLFVVFTIIDFSIAVYDKGAVVTASRVGARQGSLYWIDPTNYSTTNSRQNIRIRESMIRSGTDVYLDLTVRSQSASPPSYKVAPETGGVITLTKNQVVQGVSRAEVIVDLDYTYQGVTAVPWIPPLKVSASAGALVEADL